MWPSRASQEDQPGEAVAVANKTARIVWALLTSNEEYRAPVAAAA
ncbi:MAG: hypothetical protein ABIO43_05865 [Sphingomicrobium sp.]